ncbi:hypothetical protein SAMN06272771_7715 [Streptomyces sp. Ag82_O1-12]|uniref:hypothetical protein n=1 Tax=unclassified Streptomyces TaxID=2593676 RepID=UPI000BCAE67C|nr:MULTISPECIES: hypothetical protein [unclassified Streptomyces]SMQ21985.1 hypothetical protein SAMN06272771_7715 [Streptomyces sp. Ag82_O1-12]SOE08248.1 hypothetical protein SAMN06272727_7740 [Streptomyces sp. Ag82_G6-1]
MSRETEFNPWQWDRKNAMAGRSRLTIERHGHEVTLDHQGVSIDGERIVRDNPGTGEHGFDLTPDGRVMYRGKEVAAIGPHPEGTANPGEITVWGKDGPNSSERKEREETERQQRDSRYRADQQHQQELTRGQERSL